ncbi:unnamed protein product [Miscanthus lutarioriparius]|uniref:NB-ARC domain-containing protein n=1 Tax=Miscanthus lutarioriparius TaxID=422564 RepID=A0A811Q9Y9_9POAL|nr:unnamed protein product [Miscanthus lutarioriparius]
MEYGQTHIYVVSFCLRRQQEVCKGVPAKKHLSNKESKDVASVLGRDQEKHQIISKLADDKHVIKTISISGLGGSGKTTLAKLVFNDCSIVEKHFEVRLWVHVSQEFDVDKLIKKLFEAFVDNNPGQHALPFMIKTISDKLTGKRLLLVLDDVWTESLIQWEKFMVHLKSSGPGSRILLTARSRRVAETVRSIDQFDLPFLSLDDSWQLFQQSLVIPAEGLDSEFVKVGKEIVKKCGGVPLAIKALAGVLHGMEQIQEWKSMRDSNVLDVEGKGCIVSACLMLSYLNLPSHLKQCFAICSLFPKGHNIDKEQLIDLWIAHSMITGADGVDYMEYGHRSFNSLVQMSFLQDVEENHCYWRVTCKMHDLIHDLARSILKDEISLAVPNKATSATMNYRYFSLTEQPGNFPSKKTFKKARAIFVCPPYQKGDDTIFGNTLKDARPLRSITMENVFLVAVPNAIFQVKNLKYLAISGLRCQALPEAISDFWTLQALHVTCSDLLDLLKTFDSIADYHMISSINLSFCMMLRMLPNYIGRNEKLRVLRLADTRIERLPSSITTLRNLECLDLHRCQELVDLPEGIGNMEKLQVLNLEGCKKLAGMPIGIGQLSRLQKLGLFVVGISELANVSEIGEKLTIRGIGHVIEPNAAHLACLKQKTNLQRLDLQWMADDAEELVKLRMRGLRYLGEVWMVAERIMPDGEEVEGYCNFTPQLGQVQVGNCLTELEICDCPKLEVKPHLPPSLQHLKLWDSEQLLQSPSQCQGSSWSPSFSHLEELQLLNVTGLGSGHGWELLQHMTALESLEFIIFSGVQTELPESLWSLTSLWSLKVCCWYNISVLPEWLWELGSLQELTIESCDSLSSLPQSLGQLTSLQLLKIARCNALRQMPDCLGELCSLRKLEIIELPELTCLPQSICRLTTSLQQLGIVECPGITSLPQGMEGLASLEKLSIRNCTGLTSLPQGMKGLFSLGKLSVCNCPGIRSLPKGIKGLTALKELLILGCPDLQRRCKRGKGVDWHLISHIHHLDI